LNFLGWISPEASLCNNPRCFGQVRSDFLAVCFCIQGGKKSLDKPSACAALVSPARQGGSEQDHRVRQEERAEIIAKYDAAISRADLLGIVQLVEVDRREGKIELRLASVRLGKWAGSPAADRAPLEDPSLLDKQLNVDSVKDFSRRDLRLLRNLIYARRGRQFKSELIRASFEAVDWFGTSRIHNILTPASPIPTGATSMSS
jgi:YARHG domain